MTPTSPALSSNISTPLTLCPQLPKFDYIVNKIFSKSLNLSLTSRDAVLKEVRDCILTNNESRLKALQPLYPLILERSTRTFRLCRRKGSNSERTSQGADSCSPSKPPRYSFAIIAAIYHLANHTKSNHTKSNHIYYLSNHTKPQIGFTGV